MYGTVLNELKGFRSFARSKGYFDWLKSHMETESYGNTERYYFHGYSRFGNVHIPCTHTFLRLFENENGGKTTTSSGFLSRKDLYSLRFGIREDLRSRGFTNGAPTNKLTRRSRYKGKFQRVHQRLRVIRSILPIRELFYFCTLLQREIT